MRRARVAGAVVATLAALAAPAAAHALDTDPFGDVAAPALLAAAAAAPAGFEETVAFTGLQDPTVVRFAPDGRVFVAEKGGRIKVFDGLGDATPTVFADLSTQVHDFWDRGLLGMELDPGFATNGRVFVLYARNEEPFSTTMPRWPDGCPTPPGATGDGCVITGTLSRLDAAGNETRLIEKDFCQQYPSHSTGSLAFGADGMLYVSAGDGASFNFTDWGQDGSPQNPCGDPPGGAGAALSPPLAEGGALRSQDLRTPGDPVGLGGSILRLDPETGNAAPGNPLAANPDANARRIVAQGLRNPFRITMRPGTNELYIGDVGWSYWEEINRLPNPTAGVRNFGWPCYEGTFREPSYEFAGLKLCQDLYAEGASAHTPPHYTYEHSAKVVPGESCPTGSSATAGLDFYTSGPFPDAYDGALFFADYTRDCIWVMFPGANGVPDPATRQTFIAGAANPVDLQVGPTGDLFYADLDGGTIRRVRFPNNAPTARATATPSSGAAPLTVAFDGRGSSDPDPADTLTYAWDLDNDGAFDDGGTAQPGFTYPAGVHTARLRVTDPAGASDTTAVTIQAGTPPTATIETPTSATAWSVDQVVGFSGSARDGAGDPLPASRLTWSLAMEHCWRHDPQNCHTHQIQDFAGVASGSFAAPDHEFPSHLVLKLTATDASGLTDTESVRLDPRTVELRFESTPPGLNLAVGSDSGATPFTRTVIVGSSNSISAPSPQTLGATSYTFSSWSDGGAQSHNITAPATATTYRAAYSGAAASGLVAAYGFDEGIGATVADASGNGNGGSVSGATRSAAGRYGGALSFDGVNDMVSVPHAASLNLSSGVTLEAWVRPTTGGGWRTAMLKERGSGLAYSLYTSSDNGRPAGYVHVAAGDRELVGPAALATGAWTHVAFTFDAAVQRMYVNGAQVATGNVAGALTSSTGALRIGGNAVWGEWFAGLIDEVRVYNRALSPAAIQADMTTPIGSGGPPPPPTLAVTPGTLSFTATSGGADPAPRDLAVSHDGAQALSWTASASVPWLQLSPTSGASPGTIGVAPRIAGLVPGTHTGTVTVTAPGALGSPKQIDVTLTVQPPPAGPTLQVSPASLSFSATAGGASPAAQPLAVSNSGGGTLTWTAATDQPWLQAAPASGTGAGTVNVSASIAGLAAGTYTGNVTVAATGAQGSPRTVPVTLTIATAPPPAGTPVAAYGFNEGDGTAVADASGRGNAGAISGAAWTPAGRFGSALSFDGVNDLVTVPDSASLDVTSAMTMMAWVNPSTLGGADWRTVLLKEQPNTLAYALYSNADNGRPAGFVRISTDREVRGTAALPLNTWSHLAATYGGGTLRLYVNGVQVATRAQTGNVGTSAAPLRFGGNNVWGEWFAGRIDEVRVYDRALTAAQIAADMAAGV